MYERDMLTANVKNEDDMALKVLAGTVSRHFHTEGKDEKEGP